MLNPYFAFGVPLFLLLLYLGFALFRRWSKIPYLGFVLFIIAGFLSVFSFQVIQQALTEINKTSAALVEETHGYSLYLLAIPLVIGLVLVIRNIFRGYAKIKKVRLQSK
jgi:glucan phosphoethanolaminetransferase (alkaline phosphatase superfamily)